MFLVSKKRVKIIPIVRNAQETERMIKKHRVLIVGMNPQLVRRTKLHGVPLGIMVLKSFAKEAMDKEFPGVVDIEYKYFFLAEESPEDMAKEVLDWEPTIVAYSLFTWNFMQATECARLVKEARPDIILLAGGPQVSPIAVQTLENELHFDVASTVTTPGEIVFRNLLRSFVTETPLDEVEGIVFRREDGIIETTGPLTETLDYDTASTAYPKGELDYLPAGRNHAMVIEGSRGCPYDCAYCFSARSKSVKFFPLERMLAEIDEIYSAPNVTQVFFADSDIFVKKDRARAIIEHLYKYNDRDIQTEFEINIRNINEEIVSMLTKLTNFRFTMAVQTCNETALDIMGRIFISVEGFKEKVRSFRKWAPGSEFSVDVIVGLPGDTLEGFRHTLDVCLKLKVPKIAVNYPLYLLPGTGFYDDMDEYGIVPSKAFPLTAVETDTFPKADVEKALRLAIWMEILIFYYPSIAKFFHAICDANEDVSQIELLESWIEAAEEQINLFESVDSIVDVATSGNLLDWHKLKGDLLRRASTSASGLKIYAAIQCRYELDFGALDTGAISIGHQVYDFLCEHEMDAIEFKGWDALPASLTDGLTKNSLKELFSQYRFT